MLVAQSKRRFGEVSEEENGNSSSSMMILNSPKRMKRDSSIVSTPCRTHSSLSFSGNFPRSLSEACENFPSRLDDGSRSEKHGDGDRKFSVAVRGLVERLACDWNGRFSGGDSERETQTRGKRERETDIDGAVDTLVQGIKEIIQSNPEILKSELFDDDSLRSREREREKERERDREYLAVREREISEYWSAREREREREWRETLAQKEIECEEKLREMHENWSRYHQDTVSRSVSGEASYIS